MSMGDQPIVIKRVKKVIGGGHHGGAWKVAYADFVTAMMAFFLLMWLINTTSPEQKRGIADYFAPASVSATTSGAGGLLGGTAPRGRGRQEGGLAVDRPGRQPRFAPPQRRQVEGRREIGLHRPGGQRRGTRTAAEERGCGLRVRRPVPAPGAAGHAGTG